LGLPWDLIGRMASLAATYALEQPGSQNHYYTPADFVSRFRMHFEDAGYLAAMHQS
jgi:adenosine kinase